MVVVLVLLVRDVMVKEAVLRVKSVVVVVLTVAVDGMVRVVVVVVEVVVEKVLVEFSIKVRMLLNELVSI